MSADTPRDLAGMRAVGRLVAETLDELEAAVAPGVTTAELDALAAAHFARRGARSGPILTYRYPGSVCISVDDEIVHGIPGSRALRDGQMITLDVAAELRGYHADAARTVTVGDGDLEARRLIDAARAALAAGIRAAQPGATLREVGSAVERVTEARGFTVVRELTGHGIGRAMHEAPTVHNWPNPDADGDVVLTLGLVFTIEPMIVAGRPAFSVDGDGWTIRTRDGSRSAHAEHTIMVAAGGPEVLTAAA
ncbi:Methionine aminopeptidase [Paraconexibacter sp. AEG42_29]|uniref:Methionine aminopeptidase n=1 Tax=Paraconexibacter sp. AEG42_29 TaxID=2997339 RepID=A0AAU7AU01_9ACTN